MSDLLSFEHLSPSAITTVNTMGFGHDHIRDQIFENVSIAFQVFGKPWPIINENGKPFRIIICKPSSDSYYAAVIYQTPGAGSSVKIFVSGALASSVEQAMVNLFDATAESVHVACGQSMDGHAALLGGGTMEMRK